MRAEHRVSASTTDMLLRRNVGVELRDGTVTRVDVWQPAAKPRGPTVLIRTPYTKELAVPPVQLDPRRAADEGFHVVVQDVRGTGASEGDFVPFIHESEDARDTMSWISEQVWSDGRVVMAGSSYVGIAQWLAAVARPPELVGIAPVIAPFQLGDGFLYRNGVPEWGLTLSWVLAGLLPHESGRLEDFASVVKNPETVKALAPWAKHWLEQSSDSPYWRALSPSQEQVAIPTLHIGGWYDVFLDGTISGFTTSPRPADRLIVGPWGHDPELSHLVGGCNTGNGGNGRAFDVCGKTLAYLTAAITGDNPMLPPVSVYVLGWRGWVACDAWPPEGAREIDCPMSGGAFDVDPADLPRQRGGRGLLVSVAADMEFGPRDQSRTASRRDVLTLELGGFPSREHRTLAGPAVAKLRTQSAGGSPRQWVVTLCVTTGQGKLINLTEGVGEAPSGDSTVVVPLGNVCTDIPPGGRLVALVSGGLLPRWRPPTTPGTQVVLKGSEVRLTVAEM